VYVDSLITVQNTNNATQQALLDAQQATLTALANSSLSAGFVETEVFSGTLVEDAWTDLDLSSAVGQKTSLVLIKFKATCSSCFASIYLRSNGDTDDVHMAGQGSSSGVAPVTLSSNLNLSGFALSYTDAQGIIEYDSSNAISVNISVVFYLNQ